MQEHSPFQLLSDIRGKAIDLAGQGVSYAAQSAGVKNIAYVVNGVNFYCESLDVKEVSTCTNLMVVPQTKRWMRGLINSKGILYSVTDLALFAGFDVATQANRGHLLLLANEDSQSSLLVNRVIGFRYFDDTENLDMADNTELPDGLLPFVKEGHIADGQNWYRLDVDALLASEQFREVQ